MHTHRKVTRWLVLRLSILVLAAVGVSEAQAQPDRSLPDLTVSMNTNPVSVPVGMGYEVQIIIANDLPPSRPSPPTDVPSADPTVPTPRVGGPDEPTITEGGADVQEAGLEFNTTFPGHHRVAIQAQPSISVRCNPSAGPAGEPDPKKEICAIGPLNKGGRWTITMVFAAVSRPVPTPGGVVVYGAHIDYLNRIDERNEGNNKAQVSMNIESPPCGEVTGAFKSVTACGSKWTLRLWDKVGELLITAVPPDSLDFFDLVTIGTTVWKAGASGCEMPHYDAYSPDWYRKCWYGKKVVMQTDGNLVVFGERSYIQTVRWADGTYAPDPYTANNEHDVVVWESATGGNSGAKLIIEDDGNVLIKAQNGNVLWTTNTHIGPSP